MLRTSQHKNVEDRQKAVEHTKTPTRGTDGGTRHEEGAPLICGLGTRGW